MPTINLFNNTLRSSATGIVTKAVSGLTTGAGRALSIVDPKLGSSLARLGQAGLSPGGRAAAAGGVRNARPKVSFSGSTKDRDYRVKLSLGQNAKIFYQALPPGQIMQPLLVSNGIIFPYTPRISLVHQAQYNTLDIVHSNYDYFGYQKSSINQITIDAEFSAQTPDEANYVLAVIHFLRSASKMFTSQDSLAGNPPPILFLDGHGDHYFPHVPVVISQFSHTLPDDVDYITTGYSNPGDFVDNTQKFSTRVPVLSAFNIVLQPIYSRSRVGEFSLEKFAKGDYLGSDSKGYI